MNKTALRKIPKMDELISYESIEEDIDKYGHDIVVQSLRESIDDIRKNILKNNIDDFDIKDILSSYKTILKRYTSSHLVRVVNATGIVIHTNLGRSLLCEDAVKAVDMVSRGYNNLEYDIDLGERGSRYSHIESIITRVTGAESALVVNNNAAAVMLVLNTLCEDKEAIVSRGQLVEIGGSFRIPEVIKFSRASLVEVGATNRTHLYDYENAINDNTGVLLKVHTSNFKVIGFTKEVPLEDMVLLGRKNNIPVVEDMGSGVLIDLSKYGLTHESTVQESIKKGVDIITFSGDKMLGGPQAGIIAGKKEYIDKIKKNQLTRALRIDKMTIAALEATLRCYLDEKTIIDKIPTLNMMMKPIDTIKKDAERLRRKIVKSASKDMDFKVAKDSSMVGGGSMPGETMDTYVICVSSNKYKAEYIEEYLRSYEVPIITRVYAGEVIIDLRTILESDHKIIVSAFKSIGDK